MPRIEIKVINLDLAIKLAIKQKRQSKKAKIEALKILLKS